MNNDFRSFVIVYSAQQILVLHDTAEIAGNCLKNSVVIICIVWLVSRKNRLTPLVSPRKKLIVSRGI